MDRRTKKFRWYTNGKMNLKVYDDTVIDAGFVPGFTPAKTYRKNRKRSLPRRYKLNGLQSRIDRMCHTKTFDMIYNELKFDNDFMNGYLKDLILERCLIYQLSTMPRFFSTIVSQLEDLYERNPQLKSRDSVKDYFSSCRL